MTIRVVPFEPRFASGVVDVILPIQRQEFDIPITLEAQPDLQTIPGFYQRDNGNFWVAMHGDAVVGTLGLLDIGERQAALRKMFVKAEYRGAQYAVAQQLLAVLWEWCAARGVREIYLGTTAKFLAAHRFYEKSGFREVTRAQLPVRFPVMDVDTKFYTRTM